MKLLEMLPDSAREWKMLFFEARQHSDTKADFRPLHKMTITEFEDQGLKDEGALASFCEEKLGPGRYLVEPVDEHNRRIDKAPHVIITTEGYMDDEDDFEDRGHGRRRSRRFSDDDLDDDDPRGARANLGDLATTLARQQHATQQRNNEQTQQLATTMMLSQKEEVQTRVQLEMRRAELDEQRRRDEREERRRDEEKAEQRRREEREEQRRREEEARKEEREERRRDEEKAEIRRKEEREEQRRADEERNRQHLAQIEAANKRSELFLGGLTALAPVIKELLHKPAPAEDPLKPLLIAKLTEKREPDAITMMILRDSLDKRGTGFDAVQTVVQGMSAANKAQMEMSSEFNMTMMKRMLDMTLQNPNATTEQKDWAQQIATLMDSAGGFLKNLFPGGGGGGQQMLPPPQQQRQLPHHQPQQRRIATGQPQQGMTAQRQSAVPQQAQPQQHQAPAPQPGAEPWRQIQVPAESPFPAGQVLAEDGRTWEQLAHEERQQIIFQVNQIPTGPLAAVIALKGIQTKAYQTQAEYQQMVQMVLKNLPVDLRVAILTNDENTVIALTKPYVEPHQELVSWFDSLSVMLWLREMLKSLIPHIEAMYGPADVQKQELANAIAAHEAAAAEAAALQQKQAEAAVAPAAPAPVEGAPAPAAEAVPEAPAQPPQQMQAAAGGATMDAAPAAPTPPPASPKSHLDDHEST